MRLILVENWKIECRAKPIDLGGACETITLSLPTLKIVAIISHVGNYFLFCLLLFVTIP